MIPFLAPLQWDWVVKQTEVGLEIFGFKNLHRAHREDTERHRVKKFFSVELCASLWVSVKVLQSFAIYLHDQERT